MSGKIKNKLTPIYSFRKKIIALCDNNYNTGCDLEDDCSVCNSNKLKQVLANIKSASTGKEHSILGDVTSCTLNEPITDIDIRDVVLTYGDEIKIVTKFEYSPENKGYFIKFE